MLLPWIQWIGCWLVGHIYRAINKRPRDWCLPAQMGPLHRPAETELAEVRAGQIFVQQPSVQCEQSRQSTLGGHALTVLAAMGIDVHLRNAADGTLAIRGIHLPLLAQITWVGQNVIGMEI